MTSRPRVNLKLSTKSLDIDVNSQLAKSEPPSRRRAKRLVLSDNESDQDKDQDPADSSTLSSPAEYLTRRLHASAEDSGSELTEPEPGPEPEAEAGPSPLAQPPTSSHIKRTKGRKPTDGPPAKKKRIQQESSDEEYHAVAPSGDNDDLVIHTKRQSKPTAKAQANKGKSTSFSVGARDERKAARMQQSTIETSRKAKTKRTREIEDDPVDIVNDAETRPNTRSPSLPKETAAPPPKRRKYPTIKKNKGVGATMDPAPSSKTSSNAVTKPVASKAPDLLKPTLGGSRVPPMMVGKTELDLRDESVYKAIFNQPGGSTPRSGIARQKKEEERRKELDKMRDEARAKRLSEMTPSFNLQTQYEKIKRFEETLGRRCLFPNVLAAKWRDLYDTERKKAFMEQARSGGNGQEGQARTHPESSRY